MMIEKGMSFDEALKIAQEKGYAEKDPTADVEGHDACRKVCILASLAFGKHVYPNQVETEGITNITLEDVSYIENAGGVIKLLGQIKYINDNEIAAFVSPAVVYNGSQLASVKDVFNAILVRGDAVGEHASTVRVQANFRPHLQLLLTLSTALSTQRGKRFSAGVQVMRTMLLIIKKESKCRFTFVPRLLLLRLMLNSQTLSSFQEKVSRATRLHLLQTL